jgi:AcrR family transcriptional regulator
LALIEGGATSITMSQIAKQADLSRQALYLIFENKADLFVALLRYVDGKRGIVQEQARIRAAENGLAALLALVDRQARLCPAYKPLADAFELLRRQDPDAEQAWEDRQSDRLEGCRVVAARIKADGKLRDGISVTAAADLIWSLTSSATWDDLVVKRGWTAAAYRRHVSEVLRLSLVK